MLCTREPNRQNATPQVLSNEVRGGRFINVGTQRLSTSRARTEATQRMDEGTHEAVLLHDAVDYTSQVDKPPIQDTRRHAGAWDNRHQSGV